MDIKTLIADFMNDRVARVMVGDGKSSDFLIERAVP